MGRSETAKCSVGLRIPLRKLVEQISETNVEMIERLMEDGFIDDNNGFKDEVFREVLEGVEDWKNCDEAKDYLLKTLGKRGDKCKSKYSSLESENISKGTLLDQHLLYHVVGLIENKRWGFSEGTNATCTELPDLAKAKEEVKKAYKGLEHFSVVLVLHQNSG